MDLQKKVKIMKSRVKFYNSVKSWKKNVKHHVQNLTLPPTSWVTLDTSLNLLKNTVKIK